MPLCKESKDWFRISLALSPPVRTAGWHGHKHRIGPVGAVLEREHCGERFDSIPTPDVCIGSLGAVYLGDDHTRHLSQLGGHVI